VESGSAGPSKNDAGSERAVGIDPLIALRHD
jgi:hypothetical protein